LGMKASKNDENLCLFLLVSDSKAIPVSGITWQGVKTAKFYF
jgi:hypothetical protein